MEAIIARWFPFTWIGLLDAEGVTVVLTDRRLIVFDVSSFSNTGDVWFRAAAPTADAHATYSPTFWRSGWWWFLQRWGGLLRLVLPGEVIEVYVDRSSTNGARAIAEALGPRG